MEKRMREALSPRREEQAALLANDVTVTAVVLMCGAPPAVPAQKCGTEATLVEFGQHIHDLGLWTAEAKKELFRIWQVKETDYGESVVLRRAFDLFLEKVYVLKREDY